VAKGEARALKEGNCKTRYGKGRKKKRIILRVGKIIRRLGGGGVPCCWSEEPPKSSLSLGQKDVRPKERRGVCGGRIGDQV